MTSSTSYIGPGKVRLQTCHLIHKFHELSFGTRNFVHKYKVIDIFSEESCESYMLVLDKQKERLRGMQ